MSASTRNHFSNNQAYVRRANIPWKLLGVFLTIITTRNLAANTVHVTVIDRTGNHIPDVVVAFLPPASSSMPAATAAATLDQVNKQFRPQVLAIQVGTQVSFPNSDNIRHQVYSFSDAKRFETKLYSGRTTPPVLFDKAGVVVLGCNIHDAMRAYIIVLDTPYFTTTDASGEGGVELPPGHYNVHLWHPRYTTSRVNQEKGYDVVAASDSLQMMLDLSPSADSQVSGHD